MIKSMTGYGRNETLFDLYKITFEIKSVNNRFLDVNFRFPKSYGFLEDKIKKLLSAKVSRGKVDVFMTVEPVGTGDVDVKVDSALAGKYINALRKICAEHSIIDDVSVSVIARFSDVFSKQEIRYDEEAFAADAAVSFGAALDAFVAMRETEGEQLKNDLSEKIAGLGNTVEKLKELSPASLSAYEKKLRARVEELLGDSAYDEGRLLTEVAIMADRIAVDEETTRLESHLLQFSEVLASGEAVGKKLDFLTQEINREFNTIGSKCNMLEMSKLVIDAKNEVEKIREQIQNIE